MLNQELYHLRYLYNKLMMLLDESTASLLGMGVNAVADADRLLPDGDVFSIGGRICDDCGCTICFH
jgi:hypothetical protein